MTIKLRTKRPDALLKQVAEALKEYAAAHPRAEIEAYRQNSVSVRVRVINPEFEGKSRVEREDELWAVLDGLPEDATAEISLLLLLTPDEARKSFASQEFDNPIPSKL
jgi:stress-induced morphogen